jgi:tetratricopeptide (TPR) repeat protein
MKIFGFRKKTKIADEINRLPSLLQKSPTETLNRIKRANEYLEAGDQESALREYQKAAEDLAAEELDLEAIAIHKNILSLAGVSLSRKSLALIEEAEALLGRARKIYETVFEAESQVDGVLQFSKAPGQQGFNGTDGRDKPDSPGRNAPQPTPIERILDLSRDLAGPEILPNQISGGLSRDQSHAPSGTSRLADMKAFDPDLPDQKPPGSLDPVSSFPDKSLDDGIVEDPVHEVRTKPEIDSLPLAKDPAFSTKDIQIDDDLEAMLSHDHVTSFTDLSASPDTDRDPDDKDVSKVSSAPQRSGSLEEEPGFDTTKIVPSPPNRQDVDLHYNLGIAYYEMDLVDKAIEEFTKTPGYGINSLESLVMLAKCYLKKGLFQDSVACLDQALKLDGLGQEQKNMLQAQLKEIKVKRSLSDPSPSKEPPH